MDLRELRALELAARSKIVFNLGRWLVPSQTTGKTYPVTIDPPSCECEDFILRNSPTNGVVCKHILAAKLVRERDTDENAGVVVDEVPKKKLYPQLWSAYNAAQSVEKDRLQVLLEELCRPVQDLPRHDYRGQPPHPTRDAIFSMVFKVYCGLSSRRFSSDLREAHRRGHVASEIPGMKTHSFMENAEHTPILKSLIAQSALPLKAVETTFAIDSSGFGSSRFETWIDEKYGQTRRKCVWVKTHLAVGTRTQVVTAVRILDKDSADSPQFVPLVKETAQAFTVGEVSADKAYTSLENFEEVAGFGGTAYLPFKSNATGGVGGLFERMFHYFQFQRDEYLEHYHRRSNVESAFSMMKRKFGDFVRSKSDVAMANEVLCKVLCHNLWVLIQEQHELGIETVFWKDGCNALENVKRVGP
jgi:hypothetical protein